MRVVFFTHLLQYLELLLIGLEFGLLLTGFSIVFVLFFLRRAPFWPRWAVPSGTRSTVTAPRTVPPARSPSTAWRTRRRRPPPWASCWTAWMRFSVWRVCGTRRRISCMMCWRIARCTRCWMWVIWRKKSVSHTHIWISTEKNGKLFACLWKFIGPLSVFMCHVWIFFLPKTEIGRLLEIYCAVLYEWKLGLFFSRALTIFFSF